MSDATAPYHATWKVEDHVLQEAKHRKRMGLTQPLVDASTLSPSEWLKEKVSSGEAFFCERRAATMTKKACKLIRHKKMDRGRVGVYEGGDDELYVAVGICQTCTQYKEL